MNKEWFALLLVGGTFTAIGYLIIWIGLRHKTERESERREQAQIALEKKWGLRR